MKRDTNTELMNNVFELVKKNQCYEKAEKIIDYFLPEIFDVIEISDCDFDFHADVQFGDSEGIYIDCYIKGHFNENVCTDKYAMLHCGTVKTLGETLEDMHIMGELAGALIYFAKEYISKNIDKYSVGRRV